MTFKQVVLNSSVQQPQATIRETHNPLRALSILSAVCIASGEALAAPHAKNPPRRLPTVVPGVPRVTGPLTATTVRTVVQRNEQDLVACYTTGLSATPGMAGPVAVRFVIGPQGNVLNAAAVLQLSDRSVGDCMARAIRGWTFPVPAEGRLVTVDIPFTLTPGR